MRYRREMLSQRAEHADFGPNGWAPNIEYGTMGIHGLVCEITQHRVDRALTFPDRMAKKKFQ